MSTEGSYNPMHYLLSLRGSEPDLPACAVAPVAPAAFSCCFLCSSNEAKSVFNADRSACSFVICNQGRKKYGELNTIGMEGGGVAK